jgi:hypothetical protein
MDPPAPGDAPVEEGEGWELEGVENLSFCEFSERILMTLPKVNKLLLIAAPSLKRSVPTVPAAIEFSDPAKSMRFNLLMTV